MISNFHSFRHTLALHILDVRLKFLHQGHEGQGHANQFTPLRDVPRLVMRNVVGVEFFFKQFFKEILVYDLETCLSRS